MRILSKVMFSSLMSVAAMSSRALSWTRKWIEKLKASIDVDKAKESVDTDK